MTKIGVVGNQTGWKYEVVHSILSWKVKPEDTIISGGAAGVDSYAQDFAKEKGLSITIHYPRPHIKSPERYFERNFQIANECDVLIAFDKKSGRAGTKNTISHARKLGKEILLFKNDTENRMLMGYCRECGKDDVEIDLDYGGCVDCAKRYAEDQNEYHKR